MNDNPLKQTRWGKGKARFMDGLKIQRMIAAHELGCRDYRDPRPMLIPVYLQSDDERDAYTTGYLMERGRHVERREQ
jgi:hypothetical protein